MKHLLSIEIITAVALLLTGSAHAQESSLADLSQARGRMLVITDDQGRQIRGTLSDVSPTGLTLLIGDSTREIANDRISRVQRRDTIEDGIWLGVAAGVGLMTATCKLDSDPEHCVYYVAYFGLPVIGGGAVIGGLIDAAIRKTLFLRPRSASAGQLTLSPVLTKDRTAMTMSWTF